MESALGFDLADFVAVEAFLAAVLAGVFDGVFAMVRFGLCLIERKIRGLNREDKCII